MSVDDWKTAEAKAAKLPDADLVKHAQDAAREFVVLWREAVSRSHRSDFRMTVGVLQDRIGIIVYRQQPL